MKSDPFILEALEGLVELGYVEKLPPRPGETEPRWRLTELGKSQPTPVKGKTMVEDAVPLSSGPIRRDHPAGGARQAPRREAARRCRKGQ